MEQVPDAFENPKTSEMSAVGKIFASFGCLLVVLFLSLFVGLLSLSIWQMVSAGLATLGTKPIETVAGMPPRPVAYTPVVDAANLLTSDEAAQLNAKLAAFYHTSGTQFVVVTIESLQGGEIADEAQKLYQNWGIGQRQNNNGVLLLIAKVDHKIRIQTGYGLEGAIPDILAKRIITNVLTPAFREKRYYEGIDAATSQLIHLAQGETASFEPVPHRSNHRVLYWVFGVAVLFIGLIIRKWGIRGLWSWALLWKGASSGGYRSSSSNSQTSGWSSSSSDSSSSSSDSWGGGSSGGGSSGDW